MSEEKYMPPKILHHGVYPFDDMTKYIRADIVEEMREALVTMIEAYRGEFGSHWGEQCEEETEEHDEVMKARAALKRLEEE